MPTFAKWPRTPLFSEILQHHMKLPRTFQTAETSNKLTKSHKELFEVREGRLSGHSSSEEPLCLQARTGALPGTRNVGVQPQKLLIATVSLGMLRGMETLQVSCDCCRGSFFLHSVSSLQHSQFMCR